MPSKKPIIHFNTDQWIINKMKHIAEEHSRSLAKEMEYLCKKHIKEYEAEHGKIQIEEKEKKKNKINPLNPYGTGYAIGDAFGEFVNDKIKKKKE